MLLEGQKEKLELFLIAYWHDKRWRGFEGATVKIKDLAENLNRMGHRVTLFLPRGDLKVNSMQFSLVEIPFFNIPFLRSISFSLFLFYHLVRRSKTVNPDVIYMRRLNSLLPACFARIKGSLFFLEVNDDPFRRDFQEGSRVLFRLRASLDCKIDEWNLKICDCAFVITTELILKILSQIPSVSPDKFVIAPSGANISLFKPLSKNSCQRRHHLDPQYKYIGFVGTLLRHQGIETLIWASKIILADEPNCMFIIVGEGPLKKYWMTQVETASLGKKYRFLGQIDYHRVPEWINAMDICVAPYSKDAGLRSPVKIFDYMACAKPTVASRIDGTTTEFENSGAVWLVEPGNPSDLATAILALLRDQNKAQLMSTKARASIESSFNRYSNAERVVAAARLMRKRTTTQV